MNKSGQWLSDCCHAEIGVYPPKGNFIYRTSPPDPIEYCTGCGHPCEPEWWEKNEYGIEIYHIDDKTPIFNEKGNSSKKVE